MTWWLPHNFEQQKPHLERRIALIRAVRGFFDEQEFWEVETPILQVSPCAEAHLHGFKTQMLGTDLKPKRDLYLHTSPEFAMKKLMVAGIPHMYQICHAFRNGEGSSRHSAEFTMLEWYRAGANYRDIMKDCVALLRHCAEKLGFQVYKYRGKTADPFLRFNFITVSEAFEKYAKIDIYEYLPTAAPFEGEGWSEGPFREAVAQKGLRVTEKDSWEDIFFTVMAEKIEPHLGIGVPTILYDYPASMAALSRKKPEDPRFAERFELYVCGLELANAFSELTDAAEQRTRFKAEMGLKQELYGEDYPIDEDFLKALEHGLPESGGIALGIDRLAMLASGADDIKNVLWGVT